MGGITPEHTATRATVSYAPDRRGPRDPAHTQPPTTGRWIARPAVEVVIPSQVDAHGGLSRSRIAPGDTTGNRGPASVPRAARAGRLAEHAVKAAWLCGTR
jgi:hypothetical protein